MICDYLVEAAPRGQRKRWDSQVGRLCATDPLSFLVASDVAFLGHGVCPQSWNLSVVCAATPHVLFSILYTEPTNLFCSKNYLNRNCTTTFNFLEWEIQSQHSGVHTPHNSNENWKSMITVIVAMEWFFFRSEKISFHQSFQENQGLIKAQRNDPNPNN